MAKDRSKNIFVETGESEVFLTYEELMEILSDTGSVEEGTRHTEYAPIAIRTVKVSKAELI